MKNRDITVTVEGALVQHGPDNDRIYLMDLGSADPRRLVPKLVDYAKEKKYGKVFAKIPQSAKEPFFEAGFSLEASVESLYGGKEDALFLGLFLDEARQHEALADTYEELQTLALTKDSIEYTKAASARLCTKDDALEMAKLYRSIFASYPFPIDDPDFIRQSMDEQTVYAAIEEDGVLVALASGECEFGVGKQYAEMTDFATIPDARGNGYALELLHFLEETLRKRGILTFYTIARAVSAGMNITFAKAGYSYGGRLKNNTNIAGKIESMNVWYKNT
jgi:putative beta-lysine N-acetyltransferase